MALAVKTAWMIKRCDSAHLKGYIFSLTVHSVMSLQRLSVKQSAWHWWCLRECDLYPAHPERFHFSSSDISPVNLVSSWASVPQKSIEKQFDLCGWKYNATRAWDTKQVLTLWFTEHININLRQHINIEFNDNFLELYERCGELKSQSLTPTTSCYKTT